MRRLPFLSMILVMAGCGGGGSAKPANSAHPAGVRSTPAGAITVSHQTAISAGQPCTLKVHVGSLTLPASVSLWIGGVYDPPASPTVADDLGGGDYQATLTLPGQLDADTAAWVRLTMADGSVIEAGRGCFALATLPATP